MARTQAKPTPEEKKETQKKKTPTKKKVETGVWPCKMNGCNKEFAREADLKRHQRTTKLHSMPGFSCPQCEATFTRTDALRRHQKSRHNGVVIEPAEGDKPKNDGEPVAGGSKSRSRSGTPSSKKAQPSGQPSTMMAQPTGGPVPPPPQGYYRQQGMNTDFLVYVGPRPQNGVMVDPNYSTIGVPTSASRLQPQPGWAPPPPWGEGPPPHMYPHFAPTYYYPHPGMIPPHMMGQPPPMPNGQPASPPPPQPQPPADAAQLANARDEDSEMRDGSKSPSDEEASNAPVIDPSLDTGGGASAAVGRPSLDITSAAVQAVFEATVRAQEAAKKADESQRSPSQSKASSPGGKEPADVDGNTESGVGEAGKPSESNPPTAKRAPSPPMDMLTEDGEPMLNPAELLTQESLASPPPS